MTSIAYTNLRKEPGMDVLPRWVELVRSDKKRASRMTAQGLRTLMLYRKLAPPPSDFANWKQIQETPFQRHFIRAPANRRARDGWYPPF